jgi:tripartite-type tricarboxylate transporter receptor subunit TctC
MKRREFIAGLGSAAAWAAGAAAIAGVSATTIALSAHRAFAQTTRTIKIVVPNPPGGGADIVARLLAEQISKLQGAAIVIENRAGAGGVIATEAVSRTAPDGNTLLINFNAYLINPLLRKLNYDPLTSFEPVCYLTTSPTFIVVNDTSPYRTLRDLFDAARAKPGDLTMASVGPGSATQIAFETLKREANLDITFVPYPGVPAAVNALLGEHVTSVFSNYGDVSAQLKAGKLRPLATASRARIDVLPEIPTVAESGYKDYGVDIWLGIFAPAKTPKATISQLASWFTDALQAPEVAAKLAAQGLYPNGTCGADFAAFLRKQYGEYGRVIRESNIKAE